MSATPAKVVVTHWVHPEVLEYLGEFCDPKMPSKSQGVWSRPEVAELAADAEGLMVCMADSVDEKFLAGCGNLRIVSATLKGYDNFDADACTRRGVWLTIVPDLLIDSTAELALGLILGMIRRVPDGDRYVRSGAFAGWRPHLYGSTLRGATVGVVGMGQLGRSVARLLKACGARLVYYDSESMPAELSRSLEATPLSLEQLVASSNVVVVALPLTSESCGLINAKVLRGFRPGAFLVNIGRGSVVDEEDVADALEAGTLEGYAADVFAMEDWALPGHPSRIPERLLRHPRTLFTPHLGSAVNEVRRDMSMVAARQVRQVLQGRRPDHAVNNLD